MKKEYKGFYCIEYDKVGPIMAMNPIVLEVPDSDEERLIFFDVERDRGFTGKVTKAYDTGLNFERDTGAKLAMELCTLAMYNQKFKNSFVCPDKFKSTEGLQKFFMKKFGGNMNPLQEEEVKSGETERD
jgi:hypothetical protein